MKTVREEGEMVLTGRLGAEVKFAVRTRETEIF